MWQKMTKWAECYHMLPLRIVAGLVFLYQGGQMLFGFSHQEGLSSTIKLMEQWQLQPAFIWAFAFGFIKCMGGLFLLTGFLARISALFLSIVVWITLWKTSLDNSQALLGNLFFEHQLLLVGICLAILLGGISESSGSK